MSGDDPRAKAAQKLIVEAKRLHDGGKHADSIATAEKAARVLGVQLEAGPDDAGAGSTGASGGAENREVNGRPAGMGNAR